MRRLPTIAILLVLLLAPQTAIPQDDAVSVTATADPEVVEVGESVDYKLEVQVRGERTISISGQPEFGGAFRVVGRTVSPRKLWRNGEVLITRVISFRLRALQPGSHSIEPPDIQVDGGTYEPEAPTVRVVDGGSGDGSSRNGRPAAEDESGGSDTEPFQLRADIEPGREPYLGEQITLVYRLLADPHEGAIRMRAPQTPEFDAFWLENLTDKLKNDSKMVNVGGRYLKSTVIQAYGLFALETGTVTVPPASMRMRTRSMALRGNEQTLESEPIEFDIQPLPDGAPDGFYEGNVGDWAFRVQTDSRRGRRGGALTVRLIADGSGNVDRVRLPSLEGFEGFEVANRTEEVDKEIQGTTLRGRKVVTCTLTPRETGEVTVPELSFSYFDPEAETYRTETSDPITFRIREGDAPRSDDESEDSESDDGAPSRDVDRREKLLSSLAGPIRNRSDARGLRPSDRALYLLSGALPIAGLVLLWLAPAISRRIQGFRTQRDEREVVDRTAEHFDRASEAPSESAPKAIHEAWKNYLARVVELPAGRVEPGSVTTALEERGVEPSDAEAVSEILGWCEQVRFSPSVDWETEELRRRAERSGELLERIEAVRSSDDGPEAGTSTAALLVSSTLALVAGGATPASANDEPDASSDPSTFERAVELQDAGEWERAAEAWEGVPRWDEPAPAVDYNLGTSLAHLGQLGGARLHLERAGYASPGHDEIEENLEIVRRLVELERAESSGEPAGRTDFEGDLYWWKIAADLEERRLLQACIAGLWLLLLGAAARRYWNRPRYRTPASWAAGLGLTVAILSGALYVGKLAALRSIEPAVVTTDGVAELRTGPSEHAPSARPRAPVVPGTMVRVYREREDWIQVGVPNQRSEAVWLRSDAVERVVDLR